MQDQKLISMKNWINLRTAISIYEVGKYKTFKNAINAS